MKHDLTPPSEMQDPFDGQPEIRLDGRRRLGILGWCSISVAGLVLAGVAAAGFFIWTIQRDRNSVFLRQQFMELLTTGLGPGNQLMLDEAGVRFSGVNPTFSVGGLAITNPETGAYAELERADFALSSLSLWRLSPEAKAIRFDGLKLVLPNSRGSADPLAANEALTLLRAALAAVNFAVSGQDPAFRTLNAIEGRNISLLRRTEDGGTSLVQGGMTVSVAREGESGIVARLRKAGTDFAIDMTARSSATAEGGTAILVESVDLTMASLFALLGQSVEGIDPKLRLVVKLHSRSGPDKALIETGVSVSARGGHIIPADKDMPPFDLDEAALDLRMRVGSPDVLVDRLQVRFNEANILARGLLSPAEDGAGGIRVRLNAERAELDRLSAGEAPVALDRASLDGVIAANLRTFQVTRLEVQEDAGRATMSGRFSLDEDGLIETQVEAQTFDLRKALRVWPVWVASNIRRWLVQHVESGTLSSLSLQTRLSGEGLRDAFNHRPVPDGSLLFTYKLDDVKLRPVLDAAPLNGLSASGVSTGRRADITVERGWIEALQGQRFDIQNAKLVVANTALRPALLEMTIPAQGRLGGLLAFLSAPSLKNLVGLPPDAAVTEGTFQGQATIALPIMSNPEPKDIRVEIRAETRNVVIDNIVKGERLEGGNFSFVVRAGQVNGKGEGRIFGVQSQIEFKTDAAKATVATMKAQLDDALLARRGIDLRPAVSGPMAASFTVPLGKPAPIEVDLDLARLKIDSGIPGIGKRAGQPGRVKFTLVNRPDGTHLDNLEFDSGTNSLRGRVELLRDGQLGKAEFTSFKVSAGDNARLSLERSRGVMKLALRANSFDMRPFLRGFQSGKIDDSKASEGKSTDLDLDLQSTVLVGFNGELLSGVEAKVSRRQGRLTQMTLRGQFSGAAVNAATTGQRGELTALSVDTTDSGSLFRFLDVYPRMFGGRLNAELEIGAKSQQGIVQVRDFTIRGESSLRQVGTSNRTSQMVQSGNDEVQFTKLRADFVRRAGRLDLKEAVMWGGQVGGTLEGLLDYAGDQVSLKGVFVPAYALNNFFASVPLLGPILGGSQYEGLFAVPFVITGKASAPVFRTNPISAIAPGFLRKLFEIQKDSR